MVDIIRNSSSFGTITRPVKLNELWPGPLDETNRVTRLAGPVMLDVYNELRNSGDDDLLLHVVHEIGRAGVQLHGWGEPDLRELHASTWRSAHRFVVNNVELIDRSREVNELAKVLKVVGV